MSDLINARGNYAPSDLAVTVAQALRATADTAQESYGRGFADPGISSLRAASDYVASLDRGHPLLWALSVGHAASGAWIAGPGPQRVMSLVGGSLNPIRSEILLAEMAIANLEDAANAERDKVASAQEEARRANEELASIREHAARIPGLEDELASAQARIGELEAELAQQSKRTEFVAARWNDELKPPKPKASKAAA